MKVQGKNPDGSDNSDDEALLDVDNLIDYMLVILYTGNVDGPITMFTADTGMPNNFYAIRDRTGREGFRFLVHDAEHTLLQVSEDRTGPFPVGEQLSQFNPQWLHQQLMQNAEYRMRFADHVQKAFFNGGALTPEASRERMLARVAELAPAVLAESARWGDTLAAVPYTPADWRREVDWILNTYLPQRSAIVLEQLRADGLYPLREAPTLLVDGAPTTGGRVTPGTELRLLASYGFVYYTLDGTDPRLPGGGLSASARRYDGSPLALDGRVTVRSRVLDSGAWSALAEATFSANGVASAANLAVTELMYNPAAPSGSEPSVDREEFEFIELRNIGPYAIDLSGVRFTTGITFDFTGAGLSTLAPGAYVILAKNPEAFRARYGAISSLTVLGPYDGNLSNGGERLTLVGADGAVIRDFTYDDASPWPTSPDGGGPSLTAINLTADLNNPANWQASTAVGGSPGTGENDPPGGGNGEPPVITGLDTFVSLDEDTSLALAFTVGDPDATDLDGLVVTVASDDQGLLPASGLVLEGAGANRTLTLTPTAERSGLVRIVVTVTDTDGLATTHALWVQVVFVNDPPMATERVFTTAHGTLLTVSAADGLLVGASDPERGTLGLTVVLRHEPSHGRLELRSDGAFVYIPNPDFAGDDIFLYAVSDGVMVSATTRVVVSVAAAPPSRPVLDPIAPLLVDDGAPVTLTVRATDSDTPLDRIRFALGPGAPAGMTIDAVTGVVRWTAHGVAGSIVTAIVTATDDSSPPLVDAGVITIGLRNAAPVVASLADATVPAGTEASWTGSFADTGAGGWTGWADYGDGAGLVPIAVGTDRTFRLAHTYGSPGTYRVTVRIADAPGASGTTTFVVRAVDQTPPTVATVEASGTRQAFTRIVVGFSEPMDASRVGNLNAYTLVGAGRDGRLGTRDDVRIRLRSAVYDTATRRVTLTPRTSLGRNQAYRVTIGSGLLTDAAGQALDGDGDGRAGGAGLLGFGAAERPARVLARRIGPLAAASARGVR
jgi:hypothetical protein